MGDASIVSILHRIGYNQKKIPIWGRKLTMDCFNILPSNKIIEFKIKLSESIQKGNQYLIIAKFQTICKGCAGNFIISFKNEEDSN